MDNLTILSALAKILDIQDFRLRDFMSSLGLDEKQPIVFYRELLKESRYVIRLIGDLQNQSNASENAMCELETKLNTQEQQIADLETELSSLEKESQQQIKKLESENHQSKTIASVLRERAQNYEGIKDFMRGRIDMRALRALLDLVSSIYDNTLAAMVSGKPEVEPVDLNRLASIRAQLREEFMLVLQIPKNVLEEKLLKAEESNDMFVSLLNQMFGPKGGPKA